MRPIRTRQSASIVLLLTFFLLASHVAAQGLPKLTDGGDDASKTDTAATQTDTKGTDTAKQTGTDTGTATATATDTAKTTGQTDSATTTKLPAATKTDDKPGLSGLPKLKGQDYPPPSVPPTLDAPFMRKSNLPEGTVFIAVGAALGFFAFTVLAWRGFLAWSVHRSVKRAANAHIAKYDQKAPLAGSKKKGPYMNTGPGSTLSLDHLSGKRKSSGGKPDPAQASLFFSPTAGAGMQPGGNRGSGYLPAGYYASGSAAPANGSNMTHIGAGVPLTNLPNGNRRYSRAHSASNSRRSSRGPTPPHSPIIPPTSRGADSLYNGSRLSTQALVGQASNQSISSLGIAPQGRAPSAYLEDLFENHTPPRSPRRS